MYLTTRGVWKETSDYCSMMGSDGGSVIAHVKTIREGMLALSRGSSKVLYTNAC